MSGHHFHVHGPHDHAVEHASHGGDDFASRIAALTAILSTAGAIFSYYGGATQNDALMHKNTAAIKKTEASDQWNYFQAKSSKQNIAELAANLTSGEVKARYLAEIDRYKIEKNEVKAKAEALEAESQHAEKLSEASLHVHHRWAQAMTAIQVSISLAAITLLTRRKWLQWASVGVAGGGLVVGVMAMLHL